MTTPVPLSCQTPAHHPETGYVHADHPETGSVHADHPETGYIHADSPETGLIIIIINNSYQALFFNQN